MQNLLKVVCEAGAATLDLFGEIGFNWWTGEGLDANTVRQKLAPVKGGKLLVTIDSPGGSVSDAIAMYNIIRETGAEITVRVQGIAASAAGYLAMAADPGKLEMPSNTLLMVHKPWLYTGGNADDLRKDAATLDTFEKALVPAYMRHWKGTPEEFGAAMAGETWYTADECAAHFGAVVTGEPFRAAAMLDLGRLPGAPAAALAFGTVPPPPVVATFTAEQLAAHDADVMTRADGIYVPKLDAATLKIDAQAKRIADLEAAAADAHNQAVRAKADAADTRALLERVTGRGLFAGDSEQTSQGDWPALLAKCGGDYVAARKKHPDAYEAYRRDCKARRA